MKRTFVSVVRLTMLVGVLVLLPQVDKELNAQGTNSCQTWSPETSSPCPSCCSTHSEIPDVPFSQGPGTDSLVSTPYNCGTASSGGCPVGCTGTTQVAASDGNCCLLDGATCSPNQYVCCDTSETCSGVDGTSGTCVPIGGGGQDPCSPTCGSGQSPIILDISGNGFSLTSAIGGVQFDISGTDHPIQMAWTAPGSDNAFLALPGANGLVNNGKQLFGNFTPQPPSNNPNGFLALAVYDQTANGGNGDGIIDSRDAIYPYLRLWIDANHDGICQPEELHTLPSLGVNSISLRYVLSRKEDRYGNVFRYRAAVNPDDPDASHVDRRAYDVFFVTLNSSKAP
jgi:hypothetical protein